MKQFRLFPLKPGQGYTEDYTPSIVPQINLEFSGAAFRFGHSMIPDVFEIRPPGGRGRSESVRLRDVLMNPRILQNEGFVDGVLNAQLQLPAPAWDPEFAKGLVDHLFENREENRHGGMDLISMNIQRGREQGLHGYNKYRELCGKRSEKYGRAETFDDLAKGGFISSAQIRALRRVYESVDDIDLFVGGTLEAPYREKAILGPAFACIIGDQFSRFKKGDRFWYENGEDRATRFKLDQLDSIRGISMARILCDNTGIEDIQPMAFRSPGGNINSVSDCRNIDEGIDLGLWSDNEQWE
jgi:peroxidase